MQRAHLVALLLLMPLAVWTCGGGDDDSNGPTDPPTTGNVRATVTADGSARADVTVRLFSSGGASALATQTTGNDGTTTFSNLDAGSYEVEVDVPDGFVLDDDEERKSVSVTAGQTANTTFALAEDFDGEVVEITASGTAFSDDDVTIAPGTKVRWRATDNGGHTVTPDGHDEWSGATIASSGAVFEHVFENVGTFEYYCQPHVDMGMTGVIRVESP